jgi:large conductance mechanosensitive channel
MAATKKKTATKKPATRKPATRKPATKKKTVTKKTVASGPSRSRAVAKRSSPAALASTLGSTVTKAGRNGLLGEFRSFINRGSVVDLAVAFVMGATFKTVVDSLAGTDKQAGILGGLIGAIFGGQQPDFSRKVLTVNGSDIPFGAFITASINFVLVSAAMFVVVKAYNRFRDSGADGSAPTTNQLLADIRDELRTDRTRGARRTQ